MAKLFVTTYALYNEGRQFESDLTGFWFDVEDYDYDELIEHFIDNELDEDPEIMFTDYEGMPKELYSESMSEADFDLIKKYAELDTDYEVGFNWLTEDRGYTIEDALNRAEDVLVTDLSPKEYAYEFVEECYDVSDFAKTYFDYDSFANDLLIDGDIDEYGNYLITNANEI